SLVPEDFHARGTPLAHRLPGKALMDAQRNDQERKMPWAVILLYLGLAGIIVYASFNNIPSAAKRVAYSEFLAAIQDGKVETVHVTNSDLIGVFKSAEKAADPSSFSTPRLPAMDESWLMQELRDKQIRIVAEPQNTNW